MTLGLCFLNGPRQAQAVTQGAGQGEPTCHIGWTVDTLVSPSVAPWGFGDKVN